MKISIMDLMGHYYGDPVNIDTPQSCAVGGAASVEEASHQQKARRGQRPLLVAAALLLVVTAAVAAPFTLTRTLGRNAMEQGASAAESTLEELPSERPAQLPAAVPGSSAEDTEETITEPQNMISSYEITGAKVRESYIGYSEGDVNYSYGQTILDENNIGCYGNIVNLDGTYYTLTGNGPELLETTRLQTTVELYGSWEVDIDYAIVDGQLVFHNNTATGDYAVIDGERVTEMDYITQNGRAAASEIEWITANVATALPVEGSADTIMLGIKRNEKAIVDNCYYTFFYNIFTGEISDPLANVSGLFDYGSFSRASFNAARTRAITLHFGVAQLHNGENYVDGASAYICDLSTGEMTSLDDLAAPVLLEPENPETIVEVRPSEYYWADDDTLLFEVGERTPNGKERGITEDGEYISDYDYACWLYSYDMVTGTVNYRLRLGDGETYSSSMGFGFDQQYLNLSSQDDPRYQMIDTATGAGYFLDLTLDSYSVDTTVDRTVYYTNDDEVYLIDAAGKCWIKLSDYMEIPENNKSNNIGTSVKLLTNEWLCLMTEDTVYCYHIPEDLPLTPLTAK